MDNGLCFYDKSRLILQGGTIGTLCYICLTCGRQFQRRVGELEISEIIKEERKKEERPYFVK